MINLLRGDFYKLFHTKVLYVCTIILMCYVGIVAAAFYSLDHMPQEKKEMIQEANAGQGVSLTIDDEADLSEQFLQSGTQFAGIIVEESGVIVLIVGIMVAIMVGSEFKERTIKSMVAKGYKRERIVFTKIIVSGVAVIIMVSCAVIFACIGGAILTGNINSLSSVELQASVRCFFGAIATFVAFSSLYTLVVLVVRNVELSVVINTIIIMMLPNILGMIERTWKIPISKFQLTEALFKVTESNGNTSSLVHLAVLFVSYVVISAFLSCVFFKGADVK